MYLSQHIVPVRDMHIADVLLRLRQVGTSGAPIKIDIREVVAGTYGRAIASGIAPRTADLQLAFADTPRLAGGGEYAVVINSESPDYAIAVAEIGKYDGVTGRYFTGADQMGVLRVSKDGQAWEHIKGVCAWMTVRRARFSPTQRIISIAEIDVVDATSIAPHITVSLPAAGTRVDVIITLPDGRAVETPPGVTATLPSAVTGRITLAARLTGTADDTPTLHPDGQIIIGHQAASGDYVSRAFVCGDDRRVRVRVRGYVTGPATITPKIQRANGSWLTPTLLSREDAGDGWSDYTYDAPGFSAPITRVRLDMTGTPAHRPLVQSLVALPLNL
ncbi:hypothetical protein [Castellaniella sp.]|uniref:hypothetical protein n=1 Tax=Castellaniella sp. TaxID=1955812 RepID=UPI002AFE0FFF|nr:hypothetical protein [Castellaniella sp.]